MKKLNILIIAFLFSAGMAFAQSNDATIDQIGDDHEATINQAGGQNQAYIEQTADAGREGDDVGNATVTQQGDENYVDLRQRSFFGDSEASILQIGNENSVHGTNENNPFYQNHGLNIIDVVMDGDRNTLYSLRGEAQKNVNTFELDILGSDNEVGMAQEGGLGFVDIDGDFNDVTLWQHARGGGLETANIDIAGDQNNVDVSQEGGNNTASVNVSGSWNDATITQNQ